MAFEHAPPCKKYPAAHCVQLAVVIQVLQFAEHAKQAPLLNLYPLLQVVHCTIDPTFKHALQLTRLHKLHNPLVT